MPHTPRRKNDFLCWSFSPTPVCCWLIELHHGHSQAGGGWLCAGPVHQGPLSVGLTIIHPLPTSSYHTLFFFPQTWTSVRPAPTVAGTASAAWTRWARSCASRGSPALRATGWGTAFARVSFHWSWCISFRQLSSHFQSGRGKRWWCLDDMQHRVVSLLFQKTAEIRQGQ